ncbi:MAG: S46 family peptidase [Saprospiraceae bacterium]
MRNFIKLFALLLLFGTSFATQAQETEVSPYDFGKMWTFENAPLEYFQKTYGFTPDEEWLTSVREAALRFSTFCSASFVSPNGLIMTNHHCSRGVGGALMEGDEDFEANGFYATTQAEERKAPGLFVEQLIKLADITAEVKKITDQAKNETESRKFRDSAFTMIKEKYGKMKGWDGLRLQTITYYSGGRFSLYGYKRYEDIRLVFMPEAQLGFYGGDPDNFTYPRYNLDCSFWRAYDENGKPMNTAKHYYKFNLDGVKENEPVFVVGNPGSTERYRTVAQLEYDRDFRYPIQLESMTNRHRIMSEIYEKNPSNALLNQIFSTSNGMKAINGIVEGLEDPELFERKVAMEEKIKAASSNKALWKDLETSYKALTPFTSEVSLLNPRGSAGAAYQLAFSLADYESSMKEGEKEETLEKRRADIKALAKKLKEPIQFRYLSTLLGELKRHADPTDTYVKSLMGSSSPAAIAKDVLSQTKMGDEKELDKVLAMSAEDLAKANDPLLQMGRTLYPEFIKAVTSFRGSGAMRRGLEAKIANEAFKVYGSSLPPDATFTLRLADGVVKGYTYNGTEAPYKTTYFGMYDRYFSNNKQFPWSLPKKWENPPMELLQSPINFVSTNDITGGNSGSAIINKNMEAVGLIFDGNIESLPGNFIYDDAVNRSVSVHAGGMTAALEYIYKADRLVKELKGK